jgi:hypothetical protein
VRDDVGMWVYLSPWLVQDGELPEFESGETLIDYGVRASGWLLDVAPEADGLRRHEGPDPDGFETVVYELSGKLTWVRPETSEATIRSAGIDYLTRLTDRDWSAITVGGSVRVLCGLAVVPDYEWLSFGLPNVRRDWAINEIRIERRAVEWRNDERVPNRVVAVDAIDRISRWTDEIDGQTSSYLLDLVPIDPS